MWIIPFKWSLLILILTTCILSTVESRRGGGGGRGGSRGSSSRGSSSRGSSSSSGSRGSTYDRSRDRGRTETRNPSPQPIPAPKAPDVVKPKPPPSVERQPAYNPNYKPEPNPGVNQQPPPYSPRERPPPYSPNAPPQGPPPPYNPSGGGQTNLRGQPPAYPGGSNYPSANYPRQPGSNYPQAGSAGGQGGSSYPNANYPRQPGSNYPNANYPRQPGSNYPYAGSSSYPRQPPPSYIPQQPLGANVWRPQSGMSAPAYMNYGGLPTGGNIAAQPHKKKGLLGSLMSMGGGHKLGKSKYYNSYPSPYGMGKMGGMGGMNSFLGNKGSKAAMYTILPYMAMKSAPKFYRPRFGFMPIFYPSPFYHHHYYHGHGYGYGRSDYDVYNNQYAGRCNRPIAPSHGKVSCNSTYKEVNCEVTCDEGYLFPDNSTSKENKCWHVTGVWRPEKNFPDCKPVCNRTCQNNGTCIGPDVCGCPPEYRGPNCEFYFLQCDIRKLAIGNKIKWVCTHFKKESICRVKCQEGDFETPLPDNEYRCTTEGVWTPSFIPKCMEPGNNSNGNATTGNSTTLTAQN